MSFNPSILENEEIKFVATYDIRTAFAQFIPNYPGGNAGLIVNIAGLCSFNFLSINFVVTETGLLDGPEFTDDTYSLASYPKDNNKLPKIGSLIWSGIYKERLSRIDNLTTPPSIQQFAVTGADGIYTGVNKVIIDYNNSIRVLFFIGPKVST